MNNMGVGPTKSWSWNGFRSDEGYYNKYKLEYWDKSRRVARRWGFQVHGTGAEANNPFTAAWKAWRAWKRHEKAIKARHNR